MKYLFPLILVAFLFGSCDITKRRYMPGYSIEWKHETPKPAIVKKSAASISETPVPFRSVMYVATRQTTNTKETYKKVVPALPGNSSLTHNSDTKEFSTNSITNTPQKSVSRSSSEIDTTLQKASKHPHFFTGDEEEDEYAHKSLIDGILALATPAAAFLIMLGIALSVGETIATAPAYAVVIFGLGCVVGLMFAIFAFINGFQGLNEINAQPDTYTGAGDAALGMILAALEPLGIIAYFLIRSL